MLTACRHSSQVSSRRVGLRWTAEEEAEARMEAEGIGALGLLVFIVSGYVLVESIMRLRAGRQEEEERVKVE